MSCCVVPRVNAVLGDDGGDRLGRGDVEGGVEGIRSRGSGGLAGHAGHLLGRPLSNRERTAVGQRWVDRDDPTTWTEPVVRLSGLATAPFQQAATTPALHQAFDQLAGAGRWLPRVGLGTFPLRFPSIAELGDDGWHLDASYSGPQSE